MATQASGNVGIAFALTAGAGAATALGAAVVFFPRLVKLASRRTLAAALGLSAGVMTYVSFVEIFAKSKNSFLLAGYPENMAYVYASVCFFGGVVLMVILNSIVTCLLGGHHHHSHDHQEHRITSEKRTRQASSDDGSAAAAGEEETPNRACMCCSDDPVGDLEVYQRMAEEIDQHRDSEAQHAPEHEHGEHHHEHGHSHGHVHSDAPTATQEEKIEEGKESEPEPERAGDDAGSDGENASHDSHGHDSDTKSLMRMSINTALAIGLHNFPEGLATFVAALADPSVGVVLAVAIAIHNIPEGLCVALPIYYATGRRWKAFWWACLSGASEPVAALFGWLILSTVFTDVVYAILFGAVAGMMVIISMKELLPTAHRYDPEDTVTTYAFIVGMAIMSLSLVLFVM